MTLAELQERSGEIRYVATVEEFRQLAAVAAAQQIAVVNGGYTYDSELLERLPEVVPDLVTTRFDPTELSTRFDSLDPDTELRCARSSGSRRPRWTRSAARWWSAPSSRPVCPRSTSWTGPRSSPASSEPPRTVRTRSGPRCSAHSTPTTTAGRNSC